MPFAIRADFDRFDAAPMDHPRRRARRILRCMITVNAIGNGADDFRVRSRLALVSLANIHNHHVVVTRYSFGLALAGTGLQKDRLARRTSNAGATGWGIRGEKDIVSHKINLPWPNSIFRTKAALQVHEQVIRMVVPADEKS